MIRSRCSTTRHRSKSARWETSPSERARRRLLLDRSPGSPIIIPDADEETPCNPAWSPHSLRRYCMKTLTTLTLALALCTGSWAVAEDKPVNVGDSAPSFQSTDDQGKAWKSEDHVGKKIMVIYFYPADMTGG